MAAADGEKTVATKISGYLEKKGRKKMMSCYKKYWFVLEGRLLLYYRSKDEYEAISPCKGSINLGPTCNVKPCIRIGVFQIISRTTTITLRAESREVQHKWMQAIMTALHPSINPARLSHFRYSLGELTPEPKKPLERQNTMPERLNAPKHCNPGIIQKLQKMGAQSYLDFSMTNIYKNTHSLAGSNDNVQKLNPRNTLLIENVEYETYSAHDDPECDSDKLYEKIPLEEPMLRSDIECGSRQTSLLIENIEYISISESNGNKNDDEKIYTEPKYEVIDYNENSMTLGYSSPDISPTDKENPYSVPMLSSEDEIFENPQHAQISPKNSSGSSESLNEERSSSKLFKGFGKKNKSNKGVEGKKTGLKKSESFLQRVWKKKNKNKKNRNNELHLANNNTLNELELSDAGTIKMLSALQNVLESKKPIIEKTLITESRKSEISQDNVHYMNSPPIDPGDVDNRCPELPPRNQKPTDMSPYHDVPKNNQAIPTSAEMTETLEHLDPQKVNRIEDHRTEEDTPQEGKVRNLIKRFSEEFEGVEIRHKKTWKTPVLGADRRSGELDRLLNELSKVTTAPIMTPGVTSSLVNPEMSDSELLKLIPIRRRRLSDPDYDVPRSHKLVNLPTQKENEITGTRFFGPALDLITSDNAKHQQSPTNWDSMTPDSLELDAHHKRPICCDEDNNISYHSHDYLNISKNSHHRIEYLIENSLYAEPRLLLHQKTGFVTNVDHSKIEEHVSNDSVFVDSLETPT